MPFIVLEGFSGTGKTSLARGLEKYGWLRLQESAHAVPSEVPLADRADSAADYSLLGATLANSSIIARERENRNIVSEGYLLSDLAYAKIRFELNKSTAFEPMLALCKEILVRPELKPDFYILLEAGPETINQRQLKKGDRERNVTEFFRTRYYSAISEIHEALNEKNVEKIYTDSDLNLTLGSILSLLKKRGLLPG